MKKKNAALGDAAKTGQKQHAGRSTVSVPHLNTTPPHNQATIPAILIRDFDRLAGYLVHDVFYLYAQDVTPQCLLNAAQQGAAFVRVRRGGRLCMLDLQTLQEFCQNAAAVLNGFADADEMYRANWRKHYALMAQREQARTTTNERP